MTVTDIRTRGKARPGQPLPPLRDRRTLVLLLAGSYLDACQAMERGDDFHAGKASSRLLVRNSLWGEGSYQELERAMDVLRKAWPYRHGWFRRLYVVEPTKRVAVPDGPERWKTRASTLRLEPHEQSSADKGLTAVVRLMPQVIYVPADISENSSYQPSEAKAFAKPKRRAS